MQVTGSNQPGTSGRKPVVIKGMRLSVALSRIQHLCRNIQAFNQAGGRVWATQCDTSGVL